MSNARRYALMWSGGKDSYLALRRAAASGIVVEALVNMYDAGSQLVRFHATHHDLIAAQAYALGLRLYQFAVAAEKYERSFNRALARLESEGFGGLVFGNIHLNDVRSWFEERVRAIGFEHVEPLWDDPPVRLLAEFIDSRAAALVTCVDPRRLPDAWLGRPVDHAFAADLAMRPEVDACGEYGEYHTFVHQGAGFVAPVRWRPGRRRETAGFISRELLPP